MTAVPRSVRIIGLPIDLGANRRGVDMGPSAVRYAGLNERLTQLGYEVSDAGDLDVKIPEELSPGEANAKYLDEIVLASEALGLEVYGALEKGEIPVTLGGDHSAAIGSLAAVGDWFRRSRKQEIGLLWFDAHGDFNTPESTPSGNIHGMPLAVAVGLGHPRLTQVRGFAPKIRGDRTVLVGVRALDTRERALIAESGITVFTMRHIDQHGMAWVMQRAIEILTKDTVGFHVSLDIDGVDPSVAPGVGTPVPGGTSYRETHLAMEMVADTGKMTSFDLVEINPIVDRENTTAILGMGLTLSALGKRIY